DGPPDQTPADRMRRAWLSRGVRVEGLSGDGESLRARAAGRSATGLGITRADFHAFDQERSRPRPEHRLGGMLRSDRKIAGAQSARPKSADLSGRERPRREVRHYRG